MNKRYSDKLKLIIKNKTFIPSIKHMILRRIPFQNIRNKYILDLQCQDKVYRKLYKKNSSFMNKVFEENKSIKEGKFSKIIWWCWLQGFDKAPDLVKACYNSLKENMKGYKINILTYENLNDYINIPDYIMEKHKKGIITAAHFSDIIRLQVLIKYGGIWIDSTVFCTDNQMCQIMENSKMFVYQELNNPNIVASNWLISSIANNKILLMTQKLIMEYWKEHKVMDHYYFMHLFFKMSTHYYPEDWTEVKVFDNVGPHIFVKELNQNYDVDRYNQIKRLSSFHKLNYKLDYIDNGRTFYSQIIKGNKKEHE